MNSLPLPPFSLSLSCLFQVGIQLYDYNFGFVHDYAGNVFLSLQNIDVSVLLVA